MLRNNRGVVIIVVLWVCALIMWVALEISADNRLQGEEEATLWRRSQAEYLAIGGANEALARMGGERSLDLDKSRSVNWQPDGRIRAVRYNSGDAYVMIEDESEKINVNMADPTVLKKVLLKTGLDDDRAETVADVVADFIDQDETPGGHGAERDYYKDTGLPGYLPFNESLTSIDQMLLVPGITSDLFYGFQQAIAEADGGESAIPGDVIFPAQFSLFKMLTVYGSNTVLQDSDLDLDSDESGFNSGTRRGRPSPGRGKSASGQQSVFGEMDEQETVAWSPGGIYRILSCGRAGTGPPPVLLCLIVRYNPQSQVGYDVLFRKLL